MGFEDQNYLKMQRLPLMMSPTFAFKVQVRNNRTFQEMREDINNFAQLKEHSTSNMAIIVLLSHGEDGLVFGTGKY